MKLKAKDMNNCWYLIGKNTLNYFKLVLNWDVRLQKDKCKPLKSLFFNQRDRNMTENCPEIKRQFYIT